MRKVGDQYKVYVDEHEVSAPAVIKNDRVFGLMLKKGFPIEQAEKFAEFAHMLIETNKVMNLTRIIDEDDIVYSHFIDSLAPLKCGLIKDGDNVLDVGTGGGFPAIPLAIVMPSLHITAVDSISKKVDFVDKVVDKLKLNVDTLDKRVEELAFYPQFRNNVDCVTSRAVANMTMLLELLGSFPKIGGSVIAYKGKGYEQEVPEAENAALLMGLSAPTVHDYDVRDDVKHFLIEYKKDYKTPMDYPRRFSMIKKNPL